MAQGSGGGRDTISQRIAMEGGAEVKQQLADIGTAGEKAFKQIQTASETSSGPLSRLGAATSAMFASFRSAGAAFQPVIQSVGELRNRWGQFSAEMSIVANNVIPHFNEVLALGLAGAVVGLERLVVSSAAGVRETQNLAAAIGLSVKDFEALSLVADKAGVEHDKLGTLLARFSVALGKAREEQVKLSGAIVGGDGVLRGGVETYNAAAGAVTLLRGNMQNLTTNASGLVEVLRGGAKPVQDFSKPFEALRIKVRDFADTLDGNKAILIEAAKRLSAMGDSSIKAAIASQLFGRGWREIVPIFKDLGANMAAANAELEKLGLGISPQEAINARSFNAAYAELGTVIKRTGEIIGNMIGGAVAPALQAFKNLIGANVQTLLAWGNSVAVALASILDDFAKMASGVSDTKIENQSLIGFRDFLFTLGRGVKEAFDLMMRVLGEFADLWNSVFGTHLTGPILLGIIVVERFTGSLKLLLSAIRLVWAAGVATGEAVAFLVTRMLMMTVAGTLAALPWIVLAGVIAAFAAAILLLFGPMDKVSAVIGAVFGDDAAKAFDAFVANFRAAGKQLADDFFALLDSIGNLWRSAWTALGRWFEGQIAEIVAFFQPMIDAINLAIDLWNKLTALKVSGGSDPSGSTAGGFASGGRVPGSGAGDTVRALLTPGEFVQRVAAVRHYGAAAMERINRLEVPRGFDMGGLVGSLSHVGSSMSHFASGGLVAAGAGGATHVVNLTIGSETFAGLIAPADVAKKMISFARGQVVTSAGKKPSWVT